MSHHGGVRSRLVHGAPRFLPRCPLRQVTFAAPPAVPARVRAMLPGARRTSVSGGRGRVMIGQLTLPLHAGHELTRALIVCGDGGRHSASSVRPNARSPRYDISRRRLLLASRALRSLAAKLSSRSSARSASLCARSLASSCACNASHFAAAPSGSQHCGHKYPAAASMAGSDIPVSSTQVHCAHWSHLTYQCAPCFFIVAICTTHRGPWSSHSDVTSVRSSV